MLATSVAGPPTTQLPAGVILPAGVTLPPGVVFAGGTSQVGYLPIEVAGADIENIRIAANSSISVPGRVVIEGRGASDNDPDLSRISISVVRDPDLIAMPNAMAPLPPLPPGAQQPARRVGNGQVAGNGDFNLYVFEGDFRLNVNGVPANTYIKSVRTGGDDIQRSGLHLAGALPNPIQVVIGTDGGTVNGSVISSISTAMPNSVVALIPEAFDLRTRSDLYRSATTDALGTFKLTAIAPGSYKLFAWEWAEPDAWQNPEFIRAFESAGKAVTLSASGKQDNVQLNAIMLPRSGQ